MGGFLALVIKFRMCLKCELCQLLRYCYCVKIAIFVRDK
jgi:hypothetical protein